MVVTIENAETDRRTKRCGKKCRKRAL